MKKEDKELLLKDLCARLPYGVKVHTKFIDADGNTKVEKDGTLSMIGNDAVIAFTCNDTNGFIYVAIHEAKPYLFPLSSMTEEQMDSLTKFVANGIREKNILYDWYNKNHFDYRGLIPMGLANDATGLNIY